VQTEKPEFDAEALGRAAGTMVSEIGKSGHARSVGAWLLTFVLFPSIAAISGWVGAKLDTKFEVGNLSDNVKSLRGDIANLQSQQRDLVLSIAALTSDKPGNLGPLYVLNNEMMVAERRIVETQAIALAYESRKAAKRKAAEPLLTAYENRIREHKLPSDAAGEVLRDIALP
jgi:hypothetical protein